LARKFRTEGKIGDIFAHCGTAQEHKADGNDALFEATLKNSTGFCDGGLLMTNFIDFDMRLWPSTRHSWLCSRFRKL
jgi:phosphopentomutase